MKSTKKSRQPAVNIRRTYKTKAHFLRWLTEKKLLKKQAADEQSNRANRAISLSRAIAVWEDDGGAAVKRKEE